MVSLDQDLWDLVNKIKFGKVSSNFQNQLKEDIKLIKKSKKLFFLQTKRQIYTKSAKMNTTNKLPMQSRQRTKRFPTKLATKILQMKRK